MTPGSFWERSADLFCVIDGAGRLVELNPAWKTVLGWTPDELVGTRARDLAHPSDAETPWLAEPPLDRVDRVEHRWRCADGSYRWLLLSADRHDDDWHAIAKDITAIREAEAALAFAQGEIERLVLLPERGLSQHGDGDTIVRVSAQLCSMAGFEEAELVGTAPPFPFLPDDAGPVLEHAFGDARAGRRSQLEMLVRQRDGGQFAAIVDVAPHHAGGAGGILCLIRDVAFEAQETLRLASWEWDPARDRVRGAGRSIAGIEEDSTLAELALHAGEADRLALADGLRKTARTGRDFDLLYPLAGSMPVRWMRTQGSRVTNAQGDVVVRASTEEASESSRAYETAEAAQAFWQATLESLTAHVAVLDGAGRIIAVNAAWTAFGHANDRHGVGASYLEVCDNAFAGGDRSAGVVAEGLRKILRGSENRFTFEYPCATPEQDLWFTLRASRYRGPGPACIVVLHEDVTAQKHASSNVQIQARLLDAVDAAVVATDGGGCVTHWNQGAESVYGWTAAEAIGRHVTELTMSEPEFASFDAERRGSPELGSWESEVEMHSKGGRHFPAYVRSARLVDDQLLPAGFVTVSVDITARVEAETRVRSAEGYLRAVTDSMGEGLFTLDPLGHLIYLNASAENLLGWERRDIVGEHAGTALGRGDAADGFGRPGGSELLDGPVRVDDDVFVRRDGTELPVAYTSSPFTTNDGVQGRVVVFSDISARKAEEERVRQELASFAWVGRIRAALDQGHLWLAAQPILEIATRTIVQHELLLRMRDERGRTVPPGTFLPAAEASGLIREIDRWVLGEALALAGRGHAIELNLSAPSLGDPDLFGVVRDLLDRESADPSLVVFELTETALLEHEAVAQTFIERVSEIGCRVALDDFGTGYGGFTYLKRLPVHYLKIDREFVRDLDENEASKHVVEAVVALARGFGQTTIAEGVERESTLGLLAEMGVDSAQGYALGRPTPVFKVFGARRATPTPRGLPRSA